MIRLLLLVLIVRSLNAAIIAEDFADDPAAHGWCWHGERVLFGWDATNHWMAVRWDSSKTNSYFYRPLGTILADDDDFSFAFDLRLSDISIGTASNKPGTFEIAVGLINVRSATHSNLFRGAGQNLTYGPRNLVEFDYFPGFSTIAPTFATTMVSTNNRFAFAHSFPLSLTPGDWFNVRMTYTASNRVLRTHVTRNGQPYGIQADGSLHDLALENSAAFQDFRVDAFAISSYSDGQQASPFAGSVAARGVVDNISILFPDPPALDPVGWFTNGLWQVEFLARTNWSYALERSSNLLTWETVSAPTNGIGGNQTLTESNRNPSTRGYYRLRAERP